MASLPKKQARELCEAIKEGLTFVDLEWSMAPEVEQRLWNALVDAELAIAAP